MITFAETASQKIKEILVDSEEDSNGLRIRAAKVGTYTFRYGLQLVGEDDVTEDDMVVEAEGFKAYLDPQTAEWMQGATIDFVERDGNAGFQINNPAAEPQWSDPVAKKVQQVLDQRVLPSLAQHGGWIELTGVEDGVAYVQLGGGCQGCSGAQVTLNEGIKTVILEQVPEIREVVDGTDHSSGANPYMTH